MKKSYNSSLIAFRARKSFRKAALQLKTKTRSASISDLARNLLRAAIMLDRRISKKLKRQITAESFREQRNNLFNKSITKPKRKKRAQRSHQSKRKLKSSISEQPITSVVKQSEN